jgi:hypothetical protein
MRRNRARVLAALNVRQKRRVRHSLPGSLATNKRDPDRRVALEEHPNGNGCDCPLPALMRAFFVTVRPVDELSDEEAHRLGVEFLIFASDIACASRLSWNTRRGPGTRRGQPRRRADFLDAEGVRRSNRLPPRA